MVGMFSTHPHASTLEEEVREMQPCVAACEWTVVEDLIVRGYIE